jgi:ribosomal protein L11 methylase PrmA
MTRIVSSGSFRDPAGQVFTKNGEVFRSIFTPGVKDYEAAKEAGVHDMLIDAGMLISHKEVNPDAHTVQEAVYCLNHPRIPMITYPWEWSFSMLKDAARLHLEAMELLLPLGFWLRDANAFNVQYDGKGLRLIDTLSIGKRATGSPWVAYGQFCSNFLAPLSIAAYCDVRALGLWRSYIDGIPLDLAVKMIPLRVLCRPGIFMHLVLHARFQKNADRKADIGKSNAARQPTVSDRGLIGLVRSLRRVIDGIKWKRESQVWEDYQEIRTYTTQDVNSKTEFVHRALNRVTPLTVWDLGANTGEFSLISAQNGAFVVSIDGDAACTEHLYQHCSVKGPIERLLPLNINLTNPSPGLGWRGRERLSLQERGPADLVLALAVIHHMVFTSCIPLKKIAEWLSGLGKNAVVEFVPLDDPMVKKLLRFRNDEHHPYDLDTFRNSFSNYYEFLDEQKLKNGRRLFLLSRK